MMTFKAFGEEIKMTTADFADYLHTLANLCIEAKKDWSEFLKEIGFEFIKQEV